MCTRVNISWSLKNTAKFNFMYLTWMTITHQQSRTFQGTVYELLKVHLHQKYFSFNKLLGRDISVMSWEFAWQDYALGAAFGFQSSKI